MYSITWYGDLIGDAARMGAYHEALRRTVRPGCVVVDLGAGTGILALLACQLGAARVYAIEPGDAIHLGRELAALNGFAEHIRFIQADSLQARLPERADVIVSDIRGTLPLFRHHLPVLVDARKRFLAPTGALIAQQDELWTSVVEAPERYSSLTAVWNEGRFGLNLKPGARFVTNGLRSVVLKPTDVLAEPQLLATLDYTSLTGPNLSAEVTWTAQRAGTAHGLAVWFDAILVPGARLSNAPSAPCTVYGQQFFPLAQPVSVAPGDRITAAFRASLVGDTYLWCWDTSVWTEGPPPRRKAAFRQSSFQGEPLSLARLQHRAEGHVPVLSSAGRADQLIMSLMDGKRSLAEIARLAVKALPEQFSTEEDALARVADLSERYSSSCDNSEPK